MAQTVWSTGRAYQLDLARVVKVQWLEMVGSFESFKNLNLGTDSGMVAGDGWKSMARNHLSV